MSIRLNLQDRVAIGFARHEILPSVSITPKRRDLCKYLSNFGYIPWTLSKNPEIENSWIVAEEKMGSFGSRKRGIIKDLNKKYGNLAWRLAWKSGDETFLPFTEVVKLFETAYYEHFTQHPDLLIYLIENACDIYDKHPSDRDSGTDYLAQEGKSTHLQDIVIRKIVEEMGETFQGHKLIQIRSKSIDPIGKQLSPGRVPFHKPEIISVPPLKGWWDVNSVEDFYQNNKVIQVNPKLKALPINSRYGIAYNGFSED